MGDQQQPASRDTHHQIESMPLPVGALRWRCNPDDLLFDSTAELEPMVGVIGQDHAVESLEFGLETNAPGQNVFVRGLTGTGRMTLLKQLLEQIRPSSPPVRDRCYVHNFAQPDRPRLITLPSRQGEAFRARVDQLADFIRDDLGAALASEGIKARRKMIDDIAQRQLDEIMNPFKEALQEAGLALATFQAGPMVQTAIFPLHEGKPIPPEEFDQLHAQGKVADEQHAKTRERQKEFEEQLGEIGEKVNEIRKQHDEKIKSLLEKSARQVLDAMAADIDKEFSGPGVREFLHELIDDVVHHRLAKLGKETGFERLYRVNVILARSDETACPIILENIPMMRNLLGSIGFEFLPDGQAYASHMGIRAGSLLRADGGYLILDARDVLSEPQAWKVLVRTLRTGRLEIVPPDMTLPWAGPPLKPEPIDVNVKVILLGDSFVYHLLDTLDADFPNLFKVLADFETTIPRNKKGANEYARVLTRIAREEDLKAYDRSAVVAFVEEGARIAARHDKLTARFGLLADVAREAAFIADKQGREVVTADDVHKAVRRRERRADRPARQFRELVADGTIRIQTRGSQVGQINGLAILQTGPLLYGFPARITATIGPGTAGVINIEREAALSGAIHTKGFYILGGLLRQLLRADHPLAFDASVAFEQSYGGIDGDSASAAEICCLLSALTDAPLRQDLALTGAIDQMGHILPVGGVNEKVEGFFHACRDIGMTGTQGVIIPAANVGDLMLREDVVEACGAGEFHVYRAATIQEALELLTGVPTGERGGDGKYLEGTLLNIAVERAHEFWLKAAQQSRARAPAGAAG
jgi:ATP-dependent Lon protease